MFRYGIINCSTFESSVIFFACRVVRRCGVFWRLLTPVVRLLRVDLTNWQNICTASYFYKLASHAFERKRAANRNIRRLTRSGESLGFPSPVTTEIQKKFLYLVLLEHSQDTRYIVERCQTIVTSIHMADNRTYQWNKIFSTLCTVSFRKFHAFMEFHRI